MKLVLAFTAGVITGFLLTHGHVQNSNSVEFSCPEAPVCPEAKIIECHAEANTIKSLEVHQEFMMECYHKLNGCQEQLENCRDLETRLQSQVRDCKDRLYEQ